MLSHGADPDLAPAGWSKEAVHVHWIGVEPYSLAIGTARRDIVEVSSYAERRTVTPATSPGGLDINS
jgi:hypothetical protein